ncbi:GTPase-activating protein Sac7p [[Candida] anglica]
MSNESVNDISDSDNLLESSNVSSPTSLKHGGGTGGGQEFLRPNLLSYQSRSSNNVNRIRSNSLNQSEKSLRQHRDSFLQHNPLVDENSKYFGVPLEEAILQANAKISVSTSDSGKVQYGHIPLVVAKCAIYIKSNGLNVEGIFRVGGSSKRLKELQHIFNTPPDFGKKLNWEGYTVHDASSILRRYLNALPEPLIPLDLYEEFRSPLMSRPRIINYLKYKAENPKRKKEQVTPNEVEVEGEEGTIDGVLESGGEFAGENNVQSSFNNNNNNNNNKNLYDSSKAEPLTEANIDRLNQVSSSSSPQPIPSNPSVPPEQPFTSNREESQSPSELEVKKPKKTKNYRKLTQEVHEAIDLYKELIESLPSLSKQLLFYILDLLSMVQLQSEENLMSSRNLAAIFQPSILSHPNHDLDPVEYALSQAVVEFLIQYSYKLLPENGEEEEQGDVEDSTKAQPITQSTKLPTETGSVESSLPKNLTAPLQIYNRQHSRSISSAQSQDIGCYSGSGNRLPIVDSDNEVHSLESGITDDDEISNINKSNLSLDFKVSKMNIDSVLDQLDMEQNNISNEPPIVGTGSGSLKKLSENTSKSTEFESTPVAIVVSTANDEHH